jgi:hypothetical protein
MEIQREGVRPGHQHRRQALHPARQEPPLLLGPRAIGVVGGEALLGRDVQPGEQAQGPLEVEVVDVAAPLLVQELQRQEAQQGGGGGDHLRPRVAGPLDQLVEPQARQQREEQEQARDARLEPQGIGDG